jgi:NADPH-dependent 2,4-dienoyl-CoA reductase/sulfur reductase-like enzyme
MRSVDVCVIGAGPAGLTAASVAARHGLRTVLLDERTEAGGQIYHGVMSGPFRAGNALGDDYSRGRSVIADCMASGTVIEAGAGVSRIDPGGVITYVRHGRIERLQCKRTILATGAIERTVPFEGWTLPGVMTAGAAQLLLKKSGVVPSGSFVLAGSGPLLLLLATQYLGFGIRPTAILDTGGGVNACLSAARHGLGAVRNAPMLAKGLRMIGRIRRSGIPVMTGVSDLAAIGGDAVQRVRFRHKGVEKTLATDLLLVHEGVVPNVQVSVALGCRHRWDELQASLRPETDSWGETSIADVFAVGDCAGIAGAAAAKHAGGLAGLRIAEQLGRIDAGRLERESAPSRRALARERASRPFLDALFAPALAACKAIGDDVIVCRCEEVRASDVRQAVKDGARGLKQLKAFTRCGMGPCQGRICGSAVSRLIADMTGAAPADIGTYNVRFPLKPLTLEQMAAQTNELEEA